MVFITMNIEYDEPNKLYAMGLWLEPVQMWFGMVHVSCAAMKDSKNAGHFILSFKRRTCTYIALLSKAK